MNDFKYGMLAGTISTLLCNPLDVIRTHYQTNTPIQQYNFRFFYRGIKFSLLSIPCFWAGFTQRGHDGALPWFCRDYDFA